MHFNLSRSAAALLAGCVIAACAKKEAAVDTTASRTVVDTTKHPAGPAAPDAQMQAVLDQLAALGGKPIETLTPAEARKQPTPTDAVKALLTKQGKPTAPDPAVKSVDRTIPGPAGALPVRIYTPANATGVLPVVVYYHGGGWVIANKDVYDGGARAISKMANAIVVSVDYRQAPEHKFPAAHDDALATYKWALANAASIKGDPKRVAVAGESAGGNLAVATAMQARDQKLQMPLAIVSVYPIAGVDTMTPSYVENANAKPLNRAMMTWFFNNFIKTPADLTDPRINLLGGNLANLPPTTIINAQIDPLRSEGEMLASKMKAAGAQIEQKTYDGVTHEFFGMGAVVDKAMQAEQQAGDALKKAFGSTTP
ncbi:MAG TPA: alpha/beta hydrolase [Gemmatimonadaceae bacterium]